jgi:hypothetical protein
MLVVNTMFEFVKLWWNKKNSSKTKMWKTWHVLLLDKSVGDDKKEPSNGNFFHVTEGWCICYIIDQDDPSQCWTMLQNLFETKNTTRILFLLNICIQCAWWKDIFFEGCRRSCGWKNYSAHHVKCATCYLRRVRVVHH